MKLIPPELVKTGNIPVEFTFEELAYISFAVETSKELQKEMGALRHRVFSMNVDGLASRQKPLSEK